MRAIRFFAGAAKAPGDWSVDTRRVAHTLKEAQRSGRPVWLMGTAFNWVHLLDALASLNQAFQLPVGIHGHGDRRIQRSIPNPHTLRTA